MRRTATWVAALAALGAPSLAGADADPLARIPPLLPRHDPVTSTPPEIVSGPTTVVRDGITFRSAVFRTTTWHPKVLHQRIQRGDLDQVRAWMGLPPPERFRHLTREDRDVQVWAAPLAQHPEVGRVHRLLLGPAASTHPQYREVAYLGRGHDHAWFAYAPIPTWIALQAQLGLSDGDDPLAACIMGVGIRDHGKHTHHSCMEILRSAGPRAMPHVEAAVAEGNRLASHLVHALCSPDSALEPFLLRLATLDREHVAAARSARRCLVRHPRPAARALYLQWLEQRAGKRAVRSLTNALRAISAPIPGELLERVLDTAADHHDYRVALEARRESQGRALSPELLEAERAIRRLSRSQTPTPDVGAREELQRQIRTIATHEDQEAAAAIGLSLAAVRHKIGTQHLNDAGDEILIALPGHRGSELVRRVIQGCQHEHDTSRYREILDRLAR